MRRGIGVGHIVQKKQHKDNMADLGAMMTAERIARLADQLDDLKLRLKDLTLTHLHEIESDAIVRAKFRQLADSLGVDFSDLLREAAEEHRLRGSNKGNTNNPNNNNNNSGDAAQSLFAKILSIVDGSNADNEQQEVLRLGCEAIQACILERRYVGAFVPLTSIVGHVRRKYKTNHIPFHYHPQRKDKNGSSNSKGKAIATTTPTTPPVASSASSSAEQSNYALIDEGVVQEALRMVTDVLGTSSGYACMEMEGVVYVQALAGASTGSATDALTLMTTARKLRGQSAAAVEVAADASRINNAPFTAVRRLGGGGMATSAASSINRTAAAAMSLPETDRSSSSPPTRDSIAAYCTKDQLHAELPHWPMHRLDAALGGLLLDGSVWIDNDATTTTSRYWFLDHLAGLLVSA